MKMKICRVIDNLGRVVIPVDLRKMYGFNLGDKVWFSACDDGILIHSEDHAYGNCDSRRSNERELILSDDLICAVLRGEADAAGVTLEEYVDKFLEMFYSNPHLFI